MNWYIGQDIVAIKDHTGGLFKRGDEFKIKGLCESPCKCKSRIKGAILIDIGYTDSRYSGTQCISCGLVHNEFWFREYRFAPLDPIKEAISQLMEETLTTKQI